MLPIPETRVWSSSARLRPVRRRAQPRPRRLGSKLRVERVAGDVRDAAGTLPARHRRLRGSGRRPVGGRDERLDREAAEGALVDEAQLAAVVARSRAGPAGAARPARRAAGRAAGRSSRGGRPGDSSVRVERQPEVLAATLGRLQRPVRTRRADRSSAPGRCRRTARGCRTSTSATVRPTTSARSPRRTTSTSGSSGTVRTVGPRTSGRRATTASSDQSASPVSCGCCVLSSVQAAAAACCSASFLLRPVPVADDARRRPRRWR